MAFVTPITLPYHPHGQSTALDARRAHASIALPPRPTPPKTPPPSPPPQPLHVTSPAELALFTSTNSLVVLKVYSRKCRSCRRVERPFARLAQEFLGRVACLQLCAEEAQEMAQGLGVRGFPTFVVWKKGRRVDHFAGSSATVIREEIESYL